MNDSCIFCKIAEGLIPSHTLYEDGLFKVIFDITPWAKGHSLIIPKRHSENIFGLTNEESAALFPLAVKIANALKNSFQPAGLNLLQNNGEAAWQSVNHFHLHLIPRYENDNVAISFVKNETAPEAFAEQLKLVKESLSKM